MKKKKKNFTHHPLETNSPNSFSLLYPSPHAHSIFYLCILFVIRILSPEFGLQDGRGVWLFNSVLCPQCLEQNLANSGYSVNILSKLTNILSIQPESSTLVRKTFYATFVCLLYVPQCSTQRIQTHQACIYSLPDQEIFLNHCFNY